MTGRDRIVMMVVAVVAVVGAAWILVVSPEKDKASKLNTQVSAAQTQLQSAEGELADAKNAQTQYAVAYTSVVRLGKAVPASQEVPSLIYQLAQASNHRKVEFTSIVSGNGSSSTSSSSSATAASITPAGFTQMPFTFVFNGTFFDLERLFHKLDGFTVRTASGTVHVSGRLLTIQSVKLAPVGESTAAQAAPKGPLPLTGTITATAYVLPASQGLTGGATPSAPGGTGTATASTGSASPVPTASVTP